MFSSSESEDSSSNSSSSSSTSSNDSDESQPTQKHGQPLPEKKKRSRRHSTDSSSAEEKRKKRKISPKTRQLDSGSSEENESDHSQVKPQKPSNVRSEAQTTNNSHSTTKDSAKSRRGHEQDDDDGNVQQERISKQHGTDRRSHDPEASSRKNKENSRECEPGNSDTYWNKYADKLKAISIKDSGWRSRREDTSERSRREKDRDSGRRQSDQEETHPDTGSRRSDRTTERDKSSGSKKKSENDGQRKSNEITKEKEERTREREKERDERPREREKERDERPSERDRAREDRPRERERDDGDKRDGATDSRFRERNESQSHRHGNDRVREFDHRGLNDRKRVMDQVKELGWTGRRDQADQDSEERTSKGDQQDDQRRDWYSKDWNHRSGKKGNREILSEEESSSSDDSSSNSSEEDEEVVKSSKKTNSGTGDGIKVPKRRGGGDNEPQVPRNAQTMEDQDRAHVEKRDRSTEREVSNAAEAHRKDRERNPDKESAERVKAKERRNDERRSNRDKENYKQKDDEVADRDRNKNYRSERLRSEGKERDKDGSRQKNARMDRAGGENYKNHHVQSRERIRSKWDEEDDDVHAVREKRRSENDKRFQFRSREERERRTNAELGRGRDRDQKGKTATTTGRDDEGGRNKYGEGETKDPNSQETGSKNNKKRKIAEEDILTMRTGGAYIPPAKLRMMQAAITDKSSVAYQRLAWEALKKSLNGLINKVNVANIAIIVKELFKENIVRGRGLLCRSIMQAQSASPTFTHVYAAFVSIINSRFPQIGELILKRLIIQFRRGFHRNDKTICLSASRFIAHLVNQQVAHEVLALQILTLLLESPTDDSVEVSTGFLKECGSKLTEVSPKGIHAIFERLRSILHEGHLDKRIQYMIEVMFAIRKDGFKDHEAVVTGLDKVEEADQFTHLITLDEATTTEDILNVFKVDPDYLTNEEKYRTIRTQILGDDTDSEEGESGNESDDEDDGDSDEQEEDGEDQKVIVDNTETNMVALRRTIYLTIQSSLDFEECAHKLLKMDLKPGQEVELCHMILDCCAQQRTYEKFFGLLAQRFCQLNNIYVSPFEEIFRDSYDTIHRLETNKLRNVAKFFGHLLYTDAIGWVVLSHIKLNEEDTTSSSRIFIKIMFQELSEFMGLSRLNERVKDPTLQLAFEGLFPRDNPQNTRFAINFFTSIGLGGLTDELREHLKSQPSQPQKLPVPDDDSNSSSSSSAASSSSSSSSSGESSDSEPGIPTKKRKSRTEEQGSAASNQIVRNRSTGDAERNHRFKEAENLRGDDARRRGRDENDGMGSNRRHYADDRQQKSKDHDHGFVTDKNSARHKQRETYAKENRDVRQRDEDRDEEVDKVRQISRHEERRQRNKLDEGMERQKSGARNRRREEELGSSERKSSRHKDDGRRSTHK